MIKLQIEGKDVTDALCTVTLMGAHVEASAEAAFTQWLRERGYNVEKARDWEAPRDIAERLHIKPSFLSQAIRRPNCPKPNDIIYGPTGRILYIESTPALDTFLTRHLKPKTT